MKNFTCIILFFCLALPGLAQQIEYQPDLKAAEELSKQSGKPLAILVTIAPPPGVSGVLNGLDVPDVAARFNRHFINYKVDRSDSLAAPVISKYKITGFPIFLFVDSKGGLLFRRFGNMPVPLLNSMVDEAVALAGQKSLADFDGEYQAGNRSQPFLRDYINRRIQAGATDNANLIEQYVQELTVKQLSDAGQIIFILKAGPYPDGKAYSLVYGGQKKRVDSLFALQPYEVRVAINSRIIDNAMVSAIATKNLLRASMATNVLRVSWLPDQVTGARYAERRMLDYYRGVGDTTRYLQQSKWYYDQHYMRVSVDSIRKMEAAAFERIRSRAQEQALNNMPAGAALRSASYVMPANNFAQELNNGAWAVYETGTRNAIHLNTALLWSRRSIELAPTAAHYDTLAHLLYRQGYFAEAVSTQEKAVETAKVENRGTEEMETELTKMRERKL